ncbi:MAG TPA: VOC family protein [Thermotogaceae bacterium]|nr:VOC family protein [Thermotogaceae bacterium]
MKIHHFGYAVREIKKARERFKELGFVEDSQIIEDVKRSVLILFMKKEGHRIELVSPMRDGSSIDSILAKVGPTLYHICYEVDNLENSITRLKKSKYLLLYQPSEAIALGNKRVAFMYNALVGIVELVEK